MPITVLILIILSFVIAVTTTRAVERYGTGGMTAGMATLDGAGGEMMGGLMGPMLSVCPAAAALYFIQVLLIVSGRPALFV